MRFFSKKLISISASSFNLFLIYYAIEQNNKYNNFLNSLSEEEKEKLAARDWYIKKNFIRYYDVRFDRLQLNMYESKSEQEKEQILVKYRWSQLPKEPQTSTIRLNTKF